MAIKFTAKQNETFVLIQACGLFIESFAGSATYWAGNVKVSKAFVEKLRSAKMLVSDLEKGKGFFKILEQKVG